MYRFRWRASNATVIALSANPPFSKIKQRFHLRDMLPRCEQVGSIHSSQFRTACHILVTRLPPLLIVTRDSGSN
jgi:hypothetical protein